MVFGLRAVPYHTRLQMVGQQFDSQRIQGRAYRRNLIQNTPVVIISTERSQEKIDALAAKGAKAYLTKPFTPENMKSIVDQLLGQRGPTRTEGS